MSGFGCRHQSGEQCLKIGVAGRPGMRGCVLCGRVAFASEAASSDRPQRPRRKRRRPGASRH